jgi:hypothetical protein
VGKLLGWTPLLLAVGLCAWWWAGGSSHAGAVAASEPWQPEAEPREWKYIVLHHTATPTGDVDSIDREHKQRKDSRGRPWRGIGYHFVIGNGQPLGNGAIEPTFRWQQQLPGAHSGDREHNDAGIGICLVGDFNRAPPREEQIVALVKLLGVLQARYRSESLSAGAGPLGQCHAKRGLRNADGNRSHAAFSGPRCL